MYSYSPCPSPIKGTKPKETFGGDRYIYYLHCGDGIMGAYICVQTHQILYIMCSFFLYQIRLRYTNYTSITSIKQYLQQNTAFIAFSEKIKSRRKKKQKRKRWKKRKYLLFRVIITKKLNVRKFKLLLVKSQQIRIVELVI